MEMFVSICASEPTITHLLTNTCHRRRRRRRRVSRCICLLLFAHDRTIYECGMVLGFHVVCDSEYQGDLLEREFNCVRKARATIGTQSSLPKSCHFLSQS